MSWKCPRCSRINHSLPSRCICGQRVRSASSSSSRGDDGLALIDVEILGDVYPSGRYDSYSSSSSYSDSSYSSSSSYDSGSSSSDSSSSSD